MKYPEEASLIPIKSNSGLKVGQKILPQAVEILSKDIGRQKGDNKQVLTQTCKPRYLSKTNEV